ncbi:hypothetical protein HYU96_00700 [Candidatus Daviesbacteria bacterium]|nr:hypothetical protein [Candidatus Daviesbacteria bacterium]
MIITKSQPFTKKEIENLREFFDTYIKTVIDVGRKICSGGMDRHFEGEKILLNQGGIDVATKTIDFNSLINIRPNDNNNSNEIQDPEIRKKYEELTRFFFQEIL